ncbi:MAG: hypothetical protein H0T46_35415 [Deltaproteobacteria bacterium]|nr:hypothetical protein [Deltaproteobacteria bacterium]
MGLDLARTFLIENEWYWRINEAATSLTVSAALRDFVSPLLKMLKQGEARATDAGFDLVLGETITPIALAQNASDKIALNQLVGDINRAFTIAKLGRAFALLVPRRYELRGALLTEEELAALGGNSVLLIPSSRPSWRSMPVPAI